MTHAPLRAAAAALLVVVLSLLLVAGLGLAGAWCAGWRPHAGAAGTGALEAAAFSPAPEWDPVTSADRRRILDPIVDLPSPVNAPVELRAAGRHLTGIDLDARQHRLGGDAAARGAVIVFLATHCPISNEYVPTLNRLAAELEGEIAVFGAVSDPGVTRATAVRHRDEFGIAFPVLFDASGALRSELGPTHTPQAVLLDRSGNVVYSGRIDDRYAALGRRKSRADREDLRLAVESFLSGEPVAVARTEPIGCLLEAPEGDSAAGDVTYARHIAPIIHAHCVACHRPGAAAPFPLTSYAEVRRRARQIRLVTGSRIMPPWKPVPGFGHFRDERRLSEREIELIAAWCDGGMPGGDPDDLPPLPEFTDGWHLGAPDLVLEAADSFEVPPDGPDIYQYFVLPTGLEEDRMIAAIEYRPGNPRTVHHASFAFDTTGAARRLDAAYPGPGYRRSGGWGFAVGGTLGGWAMGVLPGRLPVGYGRPIRQGADLVIQTHYHPTGRPETDRATLGIHFAPPSAERQVIELVVANMDLAIPPGEADYRHTAAYTLPVDTELHSVLPHMHLLGREAKAVATLPGGQVVPLIWIRDWDFHWQSGYAFAEPLRLPRGTRIDFEARFDNSPDNPFNPHAPPRLVQWGEDSTDEMAVCFFDVTPLRPDDLPRLRRDNRDYLDRQYRAHLSR